MFFIHYTITGLQTIVAEKYRDFYKCLYYQQISNALDKNRGEEERERIMDVYFENVKMEFLGKKDLLNFSHDHCLHVLVVRKE